MPPTAHLDHLQALGQAIGQLAQLADDMEAGATVTAAELRGIAEKLLIVHTSAWDRMLAEERKRRE